MRTALLSSLFATLLVTSACATAGTTYVAKDGGGTDTAANPDTAVKTDAPVDPNCKTASPSNVCGVSPQCGCGANETCEVSQTALDGSSSCVSAGSNAIATACTKTTDCSQGLTCVFGFCRPYCNTDGAKCPQAGTGNCVNLVDNSSNPIPNLLVCRLNCTLDNPSSCGGGTGNCGPDDKGGTDCFPAGAGTTCSSSTPFACLPGYVCLTSNICKKWCKAGSNCPSGPCASLSTPVMIGSQEYGVCP